MTNLYSPTAHAEQIVARLPLGSYSDHFQPAYTDQSALLAAVAELILTQGVTTPAHVNALQERLSAVAVGESDRPIVISGRCAEPVDIHQPASELVEAAMQSYSLVLEALPNAIVIQRNRGQNAKPRSAEYATLPTGDQLLSYMGDAINQQDVNHRTADPSRLVAAAVQARDLEIGLSARADEHVPAAHEALLLPYELPFVRQDEQGKSYLLSTDLPWVGMRTNRPDGAHVELLSGLANPVGVKIGPSSTEAHLAALQAQLNPEEIPGKLVLMLRIGYDQAAVRGIVRAVRRYAPQSVVLYDIHGVTRTASNGVKIRAVSDIAVQIQNLQTICAEEGLRMHGVHLETTMDTARRECVDAPDELPLHPGGVDPQLNPVQTDKILRGLSLH